MQARFGRVGVSLLLLVAASLLLVPLSTAEAKGKKKQPPQGTVLSITGNSITVAYDKKGKSDKSGSASSAKQMTFTCDARTRVLLKTAAGTRLVTPTMLAVGDKVRVAASVVSTASNPALFAHVIEIESQAKSKSGLPSLSPSSPPGTVSTLPSLSGVKP